MCAVGFGCPFCTRASQMVRTCGEGFKKHHQHVIDHAVGGGIVCSLDQDPLRTFLADIGITFKPQQDVIIGALDELKLKTETAIAALEQSGSPYTYTVVRALRAHTAAYVTFTKVSVRAWRLRACPFCLCVCVQVS